MWRLRCGEKCPGIRDPDETTRERNARRETRRTYPELSPSPTIPERRLSNYPGFSSNCRGATQPATIRGKFELGPIGRKDLGRRPNDRAFARPLALYIIGAQVKVSPCGGSFSPCSIRSTTSAYWSWPPDIPHLGRLREPAGQRDGLFAPVRLDHHGRSVARRTARSLDYAQELKACALGQASASILARNILGATPEELRELREKMRNMLKDNGPPPGRQMGRSRGAGARARLQGPPRLDVASLRRGGRRARKDRHLDRGVTPRAWRPSLRLLSRRGSAALENALHWRHDPRRDSNSRHRPRPSQHWLGDCGRARRAPFLRGFGLRPLRWRRLDGSTITPTA